MASHPNRTKSSSRRIAAGISAVAAQLSLAVAQPVSWPSYGEALEDVFRVDNALGSENGFTNAIPDIVGPIDGSARLPIFAEGNHYPVLLPLVLEAFPQFCAQTEQCDAKAEEILILTLPQAMVVSGLQSGGFRFGNAILPVAPDGPVFPDLVMLGEGPMRRLNDLGAIAKPPIVFARHRGMGILLQRQHADDVANLEEFARSDLSFVIATPFEAGARNQYIRTLDSLIGSESAKRLFERETETFTGRLAIQHRDIPYAVMNGVAPAGVVFGHLAEFYASRWPDELAFV
ncbi:MAG: hypothetical protein ACFB00_09865 [Parvularculaceae bacterium]